MVDPHKKGFEDFYLSDEMLRALKDVGYKTPTPVQADTIPLSMAGIDLIVQSQTGTGKTAAFGIPILELVDPKPGRIDALVLAPTRELAKQVAEEFERLGAHKKISVATIYGGASYEKQYADLEVANIVCATPGRLLDILDRKKLSLANLRVLCLDEADEMLSMGFAEDLNAILKYLPEERQSLLFSATITEEIKALANSMLYYPEFVGLSGSSVAAVDVEHSYMQVRGVSRVRDLLAVLQFEQPENAIIFANTKDDTFTVTKYLKRHGLKADVLNGDLPQKERERTLANLRENKIDFLVATDVAARGIDISDLSHVINYTLPESAEVYIHRTGRTGRAGKKGKAISLVSPREMGTLFNIKKLYKFPMILRALPSSAEILAARREKQVASLEHRFDNISGLPYGAHLSVAEAIVGNHDAEKVRLVAKLLAVADGLSSTSGVVLAVPAPVTAAAPSVAPAVASEAPVDTADDVVTLDENEIPLEPGRRRRRRRRRGESDDTLDAAAAEPVVAVAPMERHDDRPERQERGERQERREAKSDRTERSERTERGERSDRPDRSERGDKTERNERRDKTERNERAEKPERSERADRPERAERSEKSGRSDSDRGGRRDRGRDRRNRRDREPAAETVKMPPPPRHYAKMWVNLGKNRVQDGSEVVDILCFLAGMEPEDFGTVSLESTFSYLEVREDYFADIIQAVNQQEYNGITIAAEAARK